MNVYYDTTTDMVEIKIGDVSEKIGILDLLDQMPSKKARLTYLKNKIIECRKKRIMQADTFIQTILDLTTGQERVRKQMIDAQVKGTDMTEMKILDTIHKAYKEEKNTLREIRYAIRLVNEEESKLDFMLTEAEVK